MDKNVEKMLSESIQTTNECYRLLREQETQDLKKVIAVCSNGIWDFDCGTQPFCLARTNGFDLPMEHRIESVKIGEDGELGIYGSLIIGDDIYECGKIPTYKLLPGQIQLITERIFHEWCYIKHSKEE